MVSSSFPDFVLSILSVLFCCLIYSISLLIKYCYHIRRLPSLEDWLPLILECLQSLISILGTNNSLVHLIFFLFPSPGDGLQASTDSNGASLADFLRQPNRLREGRLARNLQDVRPITLIFWENLDKPIRNAEEVGLGSGDAAAGEDEIAGAGEADDGGQAKGASGAGDDAEPGFGQADAGVGGEDAEVGGQGELEAAAEGQGGDCGNCWDLQVGEVGEGAAEVGEELGGSR